MSMPKAGAVLFAKDLSRIASFYEDVAAMAIVHRAPDVIVLESEWQQLVVHPIPKKIAREIDITSPPKRRTDLPVKLIFPVTSITEARTRASALGGALDPAGKAFEARGFRACDGHDPEGNVVQFRENV